MDKVIRDGKVAVLVAPGHGAGWYTWSPGCQEVLFDPDVVAWVENGKVGPVPDMEEKYGLDHFYDGGSDDLVIEWIPVGTKFIIEEYDGAEHLVTYDEIIFMVA